MHSIDTKKMCAFSSTLTVHLSYHQTTYLYIRRFQHGHMSIDFDSKEFPKHTAVSPNNIQEYRLYW